MKWSFQKVPIRKPPRSILSFGGFILSKELDTSTDISKFVARGGKLLIAHGLQDVLVSTRASEMYWKLLQDRFGPKKVDKFARFYEVPGAGHAFGAAFTPGWDSLTALENWVEKGIAPGKQIVTDTAVHAGRTRPLCEYPTGPKYIKPNSQKGENQ